MLPATPLTIDCAARCLPMIAARSVFGERSDTVPSMIERLRQNIVSDFGTLMPKSRAMRYRSAKMSTVLLICAMDRMRYLSRYACMRP